MASQTLLRWMLAPQLVLCTVASAWAVEEAEYRVLLKEDAFELRHYAPHIVAETLVEADLEDAGSQAFRTLFDYISGNNEAQQEIAMTAPVGQVAGGREIAMTAPVGQQREAGRWAVSFMMPASFSMETVPVPKDPAIRLRQVPARHIASVRYSGFWSAEGYRSNKARLQRWVEDKGWRITGEPIWARYNPPFMPWFLRRNEVLIPVQPASP